MSGANSKNTEPNEFAGVIGTFTKYGTLLVGGLCLLVLPWPTLICTQQLSIAV